MDLNLKALIGMTYLIPIAITLRKIYTPSFDIPDSISLVVAKIDKTRFEGRGACQHQETRPLELQS